MIALLKNREKMLCRVEDFSLPSTKERFLRLNLPFLNPCLIS